MLTDSLYTKNTSKINKWNHCKLKRMKSVSIGRSESSTRSWAKDSPNQSAKIISRLTSLRSIRPWWHSISINLRILTASCHKPPSKKFTGPNHLAKHRTASCQLSVDVQKLKLWRLRTVFCRSCRKVNWKLFSFRLQCRVNVHDKIQLSPRRDR